MLRSQIRELIELILPHIAEKYGKDMPLPFIYNIEKPRQSSYGDFSVDCAFQLSRTYHRSPWDLAQDICEFLNLEIEASKEWKAVIKRVEPAKPGFINFTMTSAAWLNVVRFIHVQNQKFGRSNTGNGEKVIIEYVSANPTGPLTIAHGRQACLGDTLANVMQYAGFDVFREYYLNDGGRQIQLLGRSVRARYYELINKDFEFPEDGYKGGYIKDIAKKIFDENGDDLKNLDEKAANKFFSKYATHYLMGIIKVDLDDIGVQFDEYFSEQSLKGDKVNTALKILQDKNLLYEKDGALWFLSTKFGDDKDRVLKKSDGTYTYLVPDIAYHRDKYERGFARFINLLGPDHHGYVKRLKAAIEALGYESKRLEVLIVQLTTLYKNGQPLKMSTRAGEFVSLRELIDEVGSDAARFFFLMRKCNSHLDFDTELAKERSQDNPVFYLQYAHARIASLLHYSERTVKTDVDLNYFKEPDEFEMIKLLHEFPHVVAQSAIVREPHRIVEYLKDVAALFHRFYAHHRVVTKNDKLTRARLLLCDCTRIVMRNGLRMLGISHPDKM